MRPLPCQENGCELGKVKKKESSKIPKGKSISQKPKAGEVVPAGSQVKVKVSSGD